jgi:hypothetical protein
MVAAAVALPGTASAATGRTAPVGPKAVVTLNPAASTVGSNIVASLAHSTLPAGDKVASIVINWGDGSKPVTVRALSSKVGHRYARPGSFTVRAVLTDVHHATSTGVAREAVTMPAGSYRGVDPQAPNTPAYNLVFYVSPSRTAVQDVAFPAIELTCLPGGGEPVVPLTLDSIPISASGAFSTSATQQVDYEHLPGQLNIALAGHFSGFATTGQPSLTGTLTVKMTYTNGASYKCTASNLVWKATRDQQQTVTSGEPAVGSYTGADPQAPNTPAYDFTFYVASSQTALQDVAFPDILLNCTPGNGALLFPMALDTVPVRSDGSFDATVTQAGDYAGFNAVFTIKFQGHFHGLDSTGDWRAAGSLTETMSYTNGSSYTCMANQESWYARRDTQQTTTTGLPPAGTYRGADPQAPNTPVYDFTFDVTTGPAQLQDVTFPDIIITCAPGGATAATTFALDPIVLASDGSFATTQTQAGTYRGNAATYTFDFQGHFHGLNAKGNARAAGSLTETMTYTNGVSYSCTSNKLSWSAAFSS